MADPEIPGPKPTELEEVQMQMNAATDEVSHSLHNIIMIIIAGS